MHPHIETWGSILRLYGSKMSESFLKIDNQVIICVEQNKN